MGNVLMTWGALRRLLDEEGSARGALPLPARDDDAEGDDGHDWADDLPPDSRGDATNASPDDVPVISDDEGTLIPEGHALLEAPAKKKATKKKPVAKKKPVTKKKSSAMPGTGATDDEVKAAIAVLFAKAGKDPLLAVSALKRLVGGLPKELRGLIQRDIDDVASGDSYRGPLDAKMAWALFRDAIDFAESREEQRTSDSGEYGDDKESEKADLRIKAARAAAARKVVNLLGKVTAELPEIRKQMDSHPGSEKPTSPLGRFAFPMQRRSSGGYGSKKVKGLPSEPNTKLEDELYDSIESHVSDNDPMALKPATAFRSLLKRGLYGDVIKEPSTANVYRGMSVSAKWLAAVLKLKDPKKVPDRGKVAKGFRFVPRKGASTSWSVDKKVAQKFSTEGGGSDTDFAMIMVAPLDENPARFLAGPDGFYKLDGPSGFKDEKETTALGPIKVTHIEWIRVRDEELNISIGGYGTKVWDAPKKQKHDYLGIAKRFFATNSKMLEKYELASLIQAQAGVLTPKHGVKAEALKAALESDPDAKKAWTFTLGKGYYGDQMLVKFKRK